MKKKTITKAQLAKLSFLNSVRLPKVILLNGKRYEWTGFSWITGGGVGKPTGKETRVVE